MKDPGDEQPETQGRRQRQIIDFKKGAKGHHSDQTPYVPGRRQPIEPRADVGPADAGHGMSMSIKGMNCWPPCMSPSPRLPCTMGRGILNLNARALSHSKNRTCFSWQRNNSAKRAMVNTPEDFTRRYLSSSGNMMSNVSMN